MADETPEPPPLRTPKDGASMPITFYARVAASEARRFRRAFTRENIIAAAKTMAWVAPLTILIWVYAEREQEVTEDNVTVAIGIQESDPRLVVTLVRPADGNITCSLQGPRSKLDEVIQLLQPHGNTPPIMIDLGTLPVGSSNPIPLLPKIHENAKLKNNGVNAIHCSPDNLIVDVDILRELDIPVIPPSNLANVEATFTPSSIKIRGPERLLARLKRENRFYVVADIASLPDISKPGQHPAINVSLLSPDPDPNLTLSTTTTRAALNVQQKDVLYTIQNVTINVEAPPTKLDQYKIQFAPPLLANVQVSGPQEKIAEIQKGTFTPVAAVKLTADDLRGPKTATTNFKLDLPPGVTLAPGSDTTVTYTVSDRGG